MDRARRHQSGAGAAAVGQDGKLPVVTILFVFALVTPIGIVLGPLVLNTTRFILVLAFIPCLLILLSGKRGPLILTDVALFAFILWFGVVMLYHHGLSSIERIGQNAIDLFGGYLLTRTTVTNAQQFRELVKYLGLAAALVVPWALLEAVTGRLFLNEILRVMPIWDTIPHVSGPPRLGLDRAQGTFEHPILYGVFTSTLIVLCALVAQSRALAILAAVGGFLSLSTVALLQIVLQFGALGWNAALRFVRSRWKILLIGFVTTYVLLDLASNRSPLRVFISYATFNASTGYHRVHIWNYGSQNVIDNPIFGIGLNDWARPDWLHFSDSVDNFWLLVAMWSGFPGITFMLGGVAFAIYKVLRRSLPLGSVEARYRMAWVTAMMTLCLATTTVHIWNAAYSYFFFLLGSGIWLLRASGTPEDMALTEPEADQAPARRTGLYTRFPDAKAARSKVSSEPPRNQAPAFSARGPGTRFSRPADKRE